MYVQKTIYWQDFILVKIREIRWTFGREWDLANFRESQRTTKGAPLDKQVFRYLNQIKANDELPHRPTWCELSEKNKTK